MNMVPVRSRVIVAVGYSASSRELWIQFKAWRVYGYQGVPVQVYEGLMAAPSKGRFYNRAIRGRYPAARLN